jgi:hypothetical protein
MQTNMFREYKIGMNNIVAGYKFCNNDWARWSYDGYIYRAGNVNQKIEVTMAKAKEEGMWTNMCQVQLLHFGRELNNTPELIVKGMQIKMFRDINL